MAERALELDHVHAGYGETVVLEDISLALGAGEIPPPRLLYTETELREMRKLQAIAHVEHSEAVPEVKAL